MSNSPRKLRSDRTQYSFPSIALYLWVSVDRLSDLTGQKKKDHSLELDNYSNNLFSSYLNSNLSLPYIIFNCWGYSSDLVEVLVTYQTGEIVFHHISKHQEEIWNQTSNELKGTQSTCFKTIWYMASSLLEHPFFCILFHEPKASWGICYITKDTWKCVAR